MRHSLYLPACKYKRKIIAIVQPIAVKDLYVVVSSINGLVTRVLKFYLNLLTDSIGKWDIKRIDRIIKKKKRWKIFPF